MNSEIVRQGTAHGLAYAIIHITELAFYHSSLEPEWYCGYVCVPANHPWYGKDYNDKPGFTEEQKAQLSQGTIGKRGILSLVTATLDDPTIGTWIDVHGSLTFSGRLRLLPEGWWFGFDCHHLDDNPVVQNADYAEHECIALAQQLQEVSHG